MPLPPEDVERLRAIVGTSEEAMEYWRDQWTRLAPAPPNLRLELFRLHLAEAEAFIRGRPALVEFAARKRRERPAPHPATFDASERARLELHAELMRQSLDGLTRRCLFEFPYHQAVIATTPIGLIAAARVFADTPAIVLLDEDLCEWFDGAVRTYERNPWYRVRWYRVERIEDALADRRRRFHDLRPRHERAARLREAIPRDGEGWLVSMGYHDDPLAAGGADEIWHWNGETASRSTMLSGWIS